MLETICIHPMVIETSPNAFFLISHSLQAHQLGVKILFLFQLSDSSVPLDISVATKIATCLRLRIAQVHGRILDFETLLIHRLQVH
jgi:hypothetical protein